MKFGVRECADVVLKAKSALKLGSHTFRAGEPVIYFDTLTVSTLEQAVTTSYANGGKGNVRLLAWDGEKTVTFTMTDALMSPKGLAILAGADLIQATEAKPIVSHVTEEVLVKENGKIVLTKEVNTKQDIYVMLLDNNGEMSGIPVKIEEGAVSDSVNISCPLVKEDDLVMVDYYTNYTSDAQMITVSEEILGRFFYLEGSTLFRREVDGYDLPAEIVLPKVKPQSNFSFGMSSSGDPSTFDFTMDAFPDYVNGHKEEGKQIVLIQILEADDNYDHSGAGDEGGETGEVKYERYEYNKDGGEYFTNDVEGPVTPDDKQVVISNDLP